MVKVKESSTIQANKQAAFQECPVTYVMEKIGGYWKPIILFNLLAGPKRYSDLRKSIPTITEKGADTATEAAGSRQAYYTQGAARCAAACNLFVECFGQTAQAGVVCHGYLGGFR